MASRPARHRALVYLLLAGATVYALQGGEYSTADLLRQEALRRHLLHAIDSLQHRVDSLHARYIALQTDPRLQERIVREEFGMVRGSRELLYRIIDTMPAAPADTLPGNFVTALFERPARRP